MLANYRVQTELSAVTTTEDGKAVVLGTVDGCLSVLAIADQKNEDYKQYLSSLPSRDEQVSFPLRQYFYFYQLLFFFFQVEKNFEMNNYLQFYLNDESLFILVI